MIPSYVMCSGWDATRRTAAARRRLERGLHVWHVWCVCNSCVTCLIHMWYVAGETRRAALQLLVDDWKEVYMCDMSYLCVTLVWQASFICDMSRLRRDALHCSSLLTSGKRSICVTCLIYVCWYVSWLIHIWYVAVETRCAEMQLLVDDWKEALCSVTLRTNDSFYMRVEHSCVNRTWHNSSMRHFFCVIAHSYVTWLRKKGGWG